MTCATPGGGILTYDVVDSSTLPRPPPSRVSSAERALKAQSFPPSSSAAAAAVFYPPGAEMMYYSPVAPLASPETVSETSSLASGSSGNLYGPARLTTSSYAGRMDTILQSPARSTANSRDGGLFLEAAGTSVVCQMTPEAVEGLAGYCENIPISNDSHVGRPDRQDDVVNCKSSHIDVETLPTSNCTHCDGEFSEEKSDGNAILNGIEFSDNDGCNHLLQSTAIVSKLGNLLERRDAVSSVEVMEDIHDGPKIIADSDIYLREVVMENNRNQELILPEAAAPWKETDRETGATAEIGLVICDMENSTCGRVDLELPVSFD